MKSNDNQTNKKFQEPCVNTLRRLLAATEAYRTLSPWRWMKKSDVVAVHDPQSDRTAYCIVLGSSGALSGLEALLGDRGLTNCHEIITNKKGSGSDEFFQNMNSIGLLFNNKDDLKEGDLSYCKKAGLVGHPSGLWPQFRRLEPGYAPWYLEEDDAGFLAVCLEQVVDVSRRAKDDPKILGPRDCRTFLARIPDKSNGSIVWREEHITPEPLKRVILIKTKVDWDYLKEYFVPAIQTNEVWEADCFLESTPVGDPNGRPLFPFCYLVVNTDTGFCLHVSVAEENDHGAALLDKLCEAVKTHGIYPRAILIRQPHLESVINALAVYGIAISIVGKLPAIDKARVGISKTMEKCLIKNSPKQPAMKATEKKDHEEYPQFKRRKVYQFRVSLNNIRPAIWREFEVESNITLKRFVVIVLKVMGWTNTHLHQLEIAGQQFSLPCDGGDNDFENENKFFLHDFSLKELRHMLLMYDFGDGWEHSITLEDVMEPKKGVKYPRCIQGERNCPPEDCGGPMGYLDFMDAIMSPVHPEHDSMMEWYGRKFDSEKFDLKGINRGLSLKNIKLDESFLPND